ncbi:MAG: acyltransferase [Planctomycetaceae bacterium]|nr:MAG: acyltransferase [Planctomycetaceae bacterium]
MLPDRYRPDIDGLRALAILPVVCYHAQLGCPGGFVGVDVFFVISGFLITGMITQALHAGQFRFPDFWLRRIRRLLPALTAMLFTVIAIGWWWLLPEEYRRVARALRAHVFLTANHHFWKRTGYFDPAAEEHPLLHLWSLAVEEQFYLFLPVLMWWCWNRNPAQLQRWLVAATTLSFVASCWAIVHAEKSAFYLLPYRAWELLIGSLLVWRTSYAARWSRITAETLGWLGILLILGAVCCFHRELPFPGPLALMPCLGAACCVLAHARQDTSSAQLLMHPLLRLIGKISYSWYLWHWPIMVFSRLNQFDEWSLKQRWMCVWLSVGVAWLSWKWIEQPIRERRWLSSSRTLWQVAACSTLCLLVLAVSIDWLGGFPSRLPTSALNLLAAHQDKDCIREMTSLDAQHERWQELGIIDHQSPVSWMVWGDSHAMALLPVLDRLWKEQGIRGWAATRSATPPLDAWSPPGVKPALSSPAAWSDAVEQSIQKHRIPQVLLAGRWSFYLQQWNRYEKTPPWLRWIYTLRTRQSQTIHPAKALEKTIQRLQSAGAQVWLFEEVPLPGVNVPDYLARSVWWQRSPPQRIAPSPSPELEAFYAVANSCGARRLKPAEALTEDARILLVTPQQFPTFRDTDHLSVQGAYSLQPWFSRCLQPSLVQLPELPTSRR